MELNSRNNSELLYTPILPAKTNKSDLNLKLIKPYPIDMVLLITVVILTMIGVVMVYSVTLHFGMTFLKGQIIRIGVGFLALIAAINIPYKTYQGRVKDILLFGIIVVLILTLVIGKKVDEARRWALFFQPAEFAKYIVIIWLTGYFSNLREKQKKLNNSVKIRNKFPLLPLVIVGIVLLLLLLQPAIGTSVILLLSTLFIFFLVGVKSKYLLFIIITGVILLSISITTVPYAKKRFNEFRTGATYQQQQSRIAIGSGGLTGKGLGEGKQKLFFLPKLHTDFIYSAIGEEFGFIGSFIVLLLFFILFSRGIKIGLESNEDFGQLLAYGFVIVIFLYCLVHLGVALSLLPTTGQPLPFISYGGSAIVTNLYAVGILLNISKSKRKNNKHESSFNYHRRNRRTYLSRFSSR